MLSIGTTKRRAAAACVLSPSVKHLKGENEFLIKSKVYDKITLLIAANGGKLKHGEIPRIVKKYNAAGSTFITRMVVRHLIDTKGSYVKTKPIKEVNFFPK